MSYGGTSTVPEHHLRLRRPEERLKLIGSASAPESSCRSPRWGSARGRESSRMRSVEEAHEVESEMKLPVTYHSAAPCRLFVLNRPRGRALGRRSYNTRGSILAKISRESVWSSYTQPEPEVAVDAAKLQPEKM